MAMRGQPFSKTGVGEGGAGWGAGRQGRTWRPNAPSMPTHPFSRLKPIQKMEGMTNGVAVGPQQATGLSDISSRSSSTSSFWVRAPRTLGVGPRAGCAAPRESEDGSVALLNLITPTGHGGAW